MGFAPIRNVTIRRAGLKGSPHLPSEARCFSARPVAATSLSGARWADGSESLTSSRRELLPVIALYDRMKASTTWL